MGRPGYIKIKLSSADDKALQAIKTALQINHGIDETIIDWGTIEVKAKKANRQQRHRFADTITKLKDFIISPKSIPFYDPYRNDFLVNISQFADITGRNRKTVRDWMRKDFIDGHFLAVSQWEAFIKINSTIKKLEKKHD